MRRRKLVTIVFVLLLLVANTTGAFASNWKWVATTDSDQWFLDTDTIYYNSQTGVVRFWLYVAGEKFPNGARAVRSLNEVVNTNDGYKWRDLKRIYETLDGRVVQEDNRISDWRVVPPNSKMDQVIREVYDNI